MVLLWILAVTDGQKFWPFLKVPMLMLLVGLQCYLQGTCCLLKLPQMGVLPCC